MSSPLSSLKKHHKTPIMLGSRSMPFRAPEYSEDEGKLLDEITHNMAASRIKSHRDPFDGGLPRLNLHRSNVTSQSPTPRVSHVGAPLERSYTSSSLLSHVNNDSTFLTSANTPPNDHELMTAMMSRIGLLEQKLTSQTKDIADKDKKIRILEDKVKIMQKVQGEMPSNQAHELEKKCLLLQQQIHEMEAFLADYGMIWVGEKSDPRSETYNDKSSTSGSDEESWRPESSLSTTTPVPEFKVDFNKVVENIKDLNVLAGEGVSKVQHTTDGARLKMPDPIPLTLYANGILMFNGPFRPFADPVTQQFIQDILDGYFPSELQSRYPDGIPFMVSDQRAVHFKDTRQDFFTGSGQVLGGETKPSRLVDDVKAPHSDRKYRQPSARQEKEHSGLQVTSELPGPKMTVGQFLNKLPKSVVRGGKVIDIRNSVGENLTGNKGDSPDVTVVETDTVKDMKKRLDTEASDRPLTPRNITTLRIKAETGNHTYILKMKFSETIGDLRKYINMQRPSASSSSSYDIMTAYPNKIYSDESATLESCGLTPNAVLHLRHRKR